MIKLIRYLMIVVILFVLIDRLVAYVIYYAAARNTYDQRIGKILQNRLGYKDVLLIGSSRTARGLIAKEIEDKSGLSVYNLSYTGSNIDFHLELLKLVIDSGAIPKIVVLGIDDRAALIENDSIVFRADTLTPYLNNNKIRNILNEHGDKSALISKYINTFKLGNNLSIMLPNKATDELNMIRDDGSMPLSGKSKVHMNMVYDNMTSYDQSKESSKLVSKFEEFITTCKANNIQLIILFPPNFSKPSNKFISRIKQLTNKDAYVIDHSDFIKDEGNFYDASHLNENGAKLLSLKVGETIKKIHGNSRLK